MPNKKVLSIYILICLFSTSMLSAQIVFEDSDSVLIQDFIAKVEASHQVNIFFIETWFESKKVDLTQTKFSLPEAIEYLSRKTGLKIIQYDHLNYIFINEDYKPEFEPEVTSFSSGNSKIIGDQKLNTSKLPSVLMGIITDANTGEPIIGATLQIKGQQEGTSTNTFGKYTLQLPFGLNSILIHSVGYASETIDVTVLSDGSLNIELFEELKELEDVTITADAIDDNVQGVQTGLTKLNMKGIKSMPAFMGETDIIKSILLLPGVNNVGEGSSGFNVRGGETSQNLILLDDMIIFNPSHLFGFFTAFQSDIVNNIELYKGGIPSNYGGRLASVLQVNTREGNLKEFKGKFSAGIISSRASFEGPLLKNKASFIVGGRGSYINWLLRKTKNIDLIRSSAGFGDFMSKFSVMLGENDKITVSGYGSWDTFSFASDTSYQIQNQAMSIKWDHIFSSSSLGSLNYAKGKSSTIIKDEFGYNGFEMTNKINYDKVRYNFNYIKYSAHKIDIGIESTLYSLSPGEFIPDLENKVSGLKILPKDIGLESALYISDQIVINPNLSVILGLRTSGFSKLGPSRVYLYEKSPLESPESKVDSLFYRKHTNEKFYWAIEPRFSLRYSTSSTSSLKIGYNTIYQYLHLITNSTTVVPTDFWMNSNYYVKPEVGHQVSIGFFKNMFENKVEASFETFYKKLKNTVDYREGGNIFLNDQLESDLLVGVGKAYGTEFMIKKNSGKLTGWFSYTYSRSLRKFDSSLEGLRINKGEYYPSNFDKPHDLSIVGQVSFSKRVKFNWNFVYGTGRPITAPDSKYNQLDVLSISNYSERNQYRIPDYHRLDIGLTIEENFRNDRNFKSSWTISIYNTYGRKNAFSVYFNQEGFAYKLSVLGAIFPSITYNLNFL